MMIVLVLAGAYVVAYVVTGAVVAIADRLGLVYPERPR